jgi:hypothetical protein
MLNINYTIYMNNMNKAYAILITFPVLLLLISTYKIDDTSAQTGLPAPNTYNQTTSTKHNQSNNVTINSAFDQSQQSASNAQSNLSPLQKIIH